MGKPRLIMCSLAFGGGGAENQVWRFAEALRDEFEIRVLVGYPPADQEPPEGVVVECIGGGTRWTRLKASYDIAKHCLARKPDLIWSHYVTYNIFLARARGRGVLSCPIVLEEVIELSPFLKGRVGRALAFLVKRYYRHADRVLGYSHETVDDLRACFDVGEAQSAYLPCIGPEVRPRPERPDDSDAPVRLLAAGRMEEQKGFDVLLDAYAAARESANRPSVLTILGDGSLRPALEEQTARLGLSEHVRFPGTVKFAVYEKEMAETDFFVLSSRYEGMANVLLEALGLGVPILTTDVSGVRDIFFPDGESIGGSADDGSTDDGVREGQGAMVVEPEDAQALARGLVAMIDEPQRRKRLAAAGIARSAAFGPENVASQYAKLFGELIDV